MVFGALNIQRRLWKMMSANRVVTNPADMSVIYRDIQWSDSGRRYGEMNAIVRATR